MDNKVYKTVSRIITSEGERKLASEFTNLPFSIEYKEGEVVRAPSGTSLLAYREPRFFTGNDYSIEVWEAQPIGAVLPLSWVIDTHSIQNITYEQLVEQWKKIYSEGSPNVTIRMRAPYGTVAVTALRLTRRLPRYSLPINELKYDEQGLHKYGLFKPE